MIGAADQPRTQYLSQGPSLHLQTDGTLRAHKPPPGGLRGVLFRQDLVKPVDRCLGRIRLRTTRHDVVPVSLVVPVGLVAIAGRTHHLPHAR